MITRATLAFLMTALPACAEPLNGAEFGAYVTGKTITYDYGDGLLGIEEYMPGNRVRWAFQGDLCMNGTWFQEGEQICFVYENEGVPQCWLFYREGSGLSATFTGDDLGLVINEIDQSTTPLSCAGPDVGV
jgi:hypothetical protein